jgi:hypothetical protein
VPSPRRSGASEQHNENRQQDEIIRYGNKIDISYYRQHDANDRNYQGD